jgi:opacity protein-like surface antigen
MRKRYLFLALILLQGFSARALAQEKFGFEIGGYAGPTFWKARQFQINAPQATPPINLELGYKDKTNYGVRFNLLSRGYWGGELDYSFQKNTVTLSREGVTPVILDGNIQHFFYNTVLYPFQYSERRIIPFVTVGIGLAAYSPSSEARARAADPKIYGIGNLSDMDKRFAFNYGGGVKANIVPYAGIRVDLRHSFSDVPSYGLPKESSSPSQVVLPIQGKLQHYEISAGVYFRVLK